MNAAVRSSIITYTQNNEKLENHEFLRIKSFFKIRKIRKICVLVLRIGEKKVNSVLKELCAYLRPTPSRFQTRHVQDVARRGSGTAVSIR